MSKLCKKKVFANFIKRIFVFKVHETFKNYKFKKSTVVNHSTLLFAHGIVLIWRKKNHRDFAKKFIKKLFLKLVPKWEKCFDLVKGKQISFSLLVD